MKKVLLFISVCVLLMSCQQSQLELTKLSENQLIDAIEIQSLAQDIPEGADRDTVIVGVLEKISADIERMQSVDTQGWSEQQVRLHESMIERLIQLRTRIEEDELFRQELVDRIVSFQDRSLEPSVPGDADLSDKKSWGEIICEHAARAVAGVKFSELPEPMQEHLNAVNAKCLSGEVDLEDIQPPAPEDLAEGLRPRLGGNIDIDMPQPDFTPEMCETLRQHLDKGDLPEAIRDRSVELIEGNC